MLWEMIIKRAWKMDMHNLVIKVGTFILCKRKQSCNVIKSKGTKSLAFLLVILYNQVR